MSFDDFLGNLNNKEAETKKYEAEKPKRKETYLSALNFIFGQIVSMLKAYIDAGKLKVSTGAGHSHDEDLGHLDVKTLIINAGGRGAKFTPKSSYGFGAWAIIDIEPTATGHYAGPKPKATLVLMNETSELRYWKFRIPGIAPTSDVVFNDFTMENLQAILQVMMR